LFITTHTWLVGFKDLDEPKLVRKPHSIVLLSGLMISRRYSLCDRAKEYYRK
jgi:hypothetical protein